LIVKGGGSVVNGFSSYFNSKKLLFLENENLKMQIAIYEGKNSNYNSILEENLKLKDTLGRKIEKVDLILASILSKPNRSPYDILVIDIGVKDGAYVGQKVFALGNVPIGKIADVYESTSKVVLFSSPGEKTDVIISGNSVVMQLVGRGGGNFEMILPRDFTIEKGVEVILPGITPQVVGVVDTILSDPRDSYQKALLLIPVNIFQLKFVELEK
jgi:cell shape-determining protein MreC